MVVFTPIERETLQVVVVVVCVCVFFSYFTGAQCVHLW